MATTPRRAKPDPNITKIPGTKIVSKWEHITAKQMEKWLAASDAADANRSLSELHISKIMNDMQADRWSHTHQGIAFDADGLLRDGQHRGHAQVRLGIDMWWLVTRGLPAEAQHHMDSTRKRQLGDFEKGPYRLIRASAARTVYAFDVNAPKIAEPGLRESFNKMTISEVLDNIDAETNEKLLELAHGSYQAAARLNAFSPSSILAAATFALTLDEAKEWLRGFTEMSDLRIGDPRIALMKVRGQAGKRLSAFNERILALRCAVAWKNDEDVRVLRPSLIHSVEATRAKSETVT